MQRVASKVLQTPRYFLLIRTQDKYTHPNSEKKYPHIVLAIERPNYPSKSITVNIRRVRIWKCGHLEHDRQPELESGDHVAQLRTTKAVMTRNFSTPLQRLMDEQIAFGTTAGYGCTLMRRKKRVMVYDPFFRWFMIRARHRPGLGDVVLPLIVLRELKHDLQVECMVRNSGAHLETRSCKSLVLQVTREKSRVMSKWRFRRDGEVQKSERRGVCISCPI